MRITAVLVVVAVLGLGAGCDSAVDDPGVGARPMSAAPSGSGSSASFDREGLSARARKALIAPDALARVSVAAKPEDRFDGEFATSDYCRKSVPGEDAGSHVAHQRAWRNSTLAVFNTTHGYGSISGKDAVEATRANAQNCQTYDGTIGTSKVKHELVSEVSLNDLPGIDASYARCELLTFENEKPRIGCVAYLARGALVSSVTVLYADLVYATQDKLVEIVPIAADALIAA